MKCYQAESADALYSHLLYAVNNTGARAASRAGATKELLHVSAELYHPRRRWVVSREPALNAAFAVAEMIWIIRGRRDSAFLNYFNRALPQYAGAGRTYAGAYGWRLRRNLGFDQLRSAYLALKAAPHSRQVVLQIWDGRRDLPDGAAPRSPDVPCNVVSLLKVRGGRLEWTQIMRSNDLFRGWPYNILQWTTLQEVMAGWLGLQVGTYHHLSDSLHMYEKDGTHGVSVRSGGEQEGDLRLPWAESAAAWRRMELAADIIRGARWAKPGAVLGAIEPLRRGLPKAYRPLLCVLVAEGLRRRGDHEGAVRHLRSGGSGPAVNAALNWTEQRAVKP